MRAHDATLGSDADSRIQALVEQAHESGLFNVSTSDLRLADDVSRLGAHVIRSAASSTPSVRKLNGTDPPRRGDYQEIRDSPSTSGSVGRLDRLPGEFHVVW